VDGTEEGKMAKRQMYFVNFSTEPSGLGGINLTYSPTTTDQAQAVSAAWKTLMTGRGAKSENAAARKALRQQMKDEQPIFISVYSAKAAVAGK
jgi:hypothetical protein